MSRGVAEPATRGVRLPEDPASRVAFSDRALGNVSAAVGGGDVTSSRQRLAGLVGLEIGDMVFMGQVHGARVAVVGQDDRGCGVDRPAVAGTDALVTRDADVGLAVLVADCVPLLLVDPGQAVAAVHAGRRGVAGGIVGVSVATLTATPERVVAVLGPAIGGCCYEVPETLADEVAEAVPAARARTRWGAPALDLPAAVTSQLAEVGVRHVRHAGACTRCQRDRWFSHRGDDEGERGRQAGVVCRRSDSGHGLPGTEEGGA